MSKYRTPCINCPRISKSYEFVTLFCWQSRRRYCKFQFSICRITFIPESQQSLKRCLLCRRSHCTTRNREFQAEISVSFLKGPEYLSFLSSMSAEFPDTLYLLFLYLSTILHCTLKKNTARIRARPFSKYKIIQVNL